MKNYRRLNWVCRYLCRPAFWPWAAWWIYQQETWNVPCSGKSAVPACSQNWLFTYTWIFYAILLLYFSV